tara:strand:- start:1053 stop:1277 length:225 start_codon:yes stop_codon:yes gene_type:complete
MSANPHDFSRWAERILGEGRYALLVERKNDTNTAKQLVKDNKAGLISKHYKQQHELILDKRREGHSRYIDFENY